MRMASRYFSWDELSCRGAGYCRIPRAAEEANAFWSILDIGDEVRRDFGHPLVCRSGWRSTAHNLSIGGAWRSMHKTLALDLAPRHRDFPGDEDYALAMINLEDAIYAHESAIGGIGTYNSFIHIDCRQYLGRPIARWEDNATWRRFENTQRMA